MRVTVTNVKRSVGAPRHFFPNASPSRVIHHPTARQAGADGQYQSRSAAATPMGTGPLEIIAPTTRAGTVLIEEC